MAQKFLGVNEKQPNSGSEDFLEEKKAGAVILVKITGRVDTLQGSGFKLCFFMRQVLGVSLKDSGSLLS